MHSSHHRPGGLPPDLAEAVLAAQRGDEEAFRLLFRTVQPGLLRYLRVLVGGGPEDAEDIASETWLQIARDLGGFRGDADGFRGWAATIARHRAMDHLRRVRRRPIADLPEAYLAELAAAEDTAGSAVSAVSTADALALIAELPPDQAEAVLLRVVVGLDAAGAAAVLGKRAGTVRMAAHRGLRRLAARLEGEVPAEGFPARRRKAVEPHRQPVEPRREPRAGLHHQPAAVPPQAGKGRQPRRLGRAARPEPESGTETGESFPPGVTPEQPVTLKDMR
ncbi:RNA polymerase sigma factor [Kitasatospora sp. NPDC096147]|uniref:RNA polymerase sigma factor n=1 Tax=Kitasatospora sp. NPDC096147 TaxID=3364093 RepID=UPI003800A066